MGNKFLSIILFVSAGALLGITVLSNQISQPQLEVILQKQNQIIESQKQIQDRLDIIESQSKGLGQIGQLIQQAQARPTQPPPSQQYPQEDLTTVYTIPVEHTPVFGKKNAPVTLVEFVDFQCPFCARFHKPLVDAVKAIPDKANYMLKNFPLNFHPQAKPASKAAFAAGEQGKYFEMVDAILADNSNLNDEKYKELAGKIGLNVDKFLKDLKDKDAQYESQIQKDYDLGNQVGVQGTPSFYLNGRKTRARDVESFKREIESAAKEAK